MNSKLILPSKADMNVPKLRFKEFEGEWNPKKLESVSEKIQDGTAPGDFASSHRR